MAENLKHSCLFNWYGIPEKDSGRLIDFLTQKFGIDWVKTAKVEKIDNGKAIKVSTEKNFLTLILNNKKNEVILEIDDGRTNKFKAKLENDKLNIYKSSKQKKDRPIKDGTVIDHITGGQALNVLKILGISGATDAEVTVVTNVGSGRLGKKDIVKVEDRELEEDDVNRIALIAPLATVNIIRNGKVTEKRLVDLPAEIMGVVRCQNHNCISNTTEPIVSRMKVSAKNPVVLRCHYCEQPLTQGIAEYLI